MAVIKKNALVDVTKLISICQKPGVQDLKIVLIHLFRNLMLLFNLIRL